MGTAASASSTGAPENPRVKYSRKLEKTEKKKILLDAPVLVDVEHGSVRYRPAINTSQQMLLKGKERPYENNKGKDLEVKDHYFYHTRLNKYGPESCKENEDPFKFYYVMRGPAAAKQKKIFYVYGQGWDAKDGLRVRPSQTVGEGKDYAWSSKHEPNGLYYNLDFDSSGPAPVTDEEDKLLADLESTPDKANISLTVSSDERVLSVKARVAVKLLKLAKDIHIAFDNKELRDEDVVADLQAKADEEPTSERPDNINIRLTLI